MITGSVNARREAVIPIIVRGSGGDEQEIDAVIDTGFNGSLTLPTLLIATLGLTWRELRRALLADGREEVLDVYEATIVWDGQPRNVSAYAADTDPLVGMSLLYGYDLHIQVIDGGGVTIEALP